MLSRNDLEAANLQVLKSTQAFANQKLKEQGFLFLNDVYKMLLGNELTFEEFVERSGKGVCDIDELMERF